MRRFAFLWYGLLAVIDLYTLLCSALLALRGVLRNRWIILEVFNGLFPLVLVPAWFILPLNLFLGRHQQSLLLLPILGKFTRDYGARFLPKQPANPANNPTLTLLTHNLEYKNTQIDLMTALIQEADADLVLLQELNPQMAAGLQTQLAEAYPYQALHPAEDFCGQGVFSRYPITDDQYWRRQMGNQRVRIDYQGTRLTVYNVHPAAPFWHLRLNYRPRLREIAELVRISLEEDGPRILAGDFNMSDQSREYARLEKHYRDTFDEVGQGLGLTIHDYLLILRLDYVFHSAHLQGIDAKVWPSAGGSDHRPVWVKLALLPTNSQ